MNKKTVIANWKLHGSKQEINNFIKLLNKEKLELNNHLYKVILAFPSIYLHFAHNIITNSNIFLAAQNVDVNLYGAFTGEVSVNMLKDIGIVYVIIGHSERRMYHQENNDTIANKFKLIKDANLIPILCIGESYQEKYLGKTESVCQKQLDLILQKCGPSAFHNSIIAYEPIWSIGSGHIPSMNEIQKNHFFIKTHIRNMNPMSNDNFSIYYGGSVNEKNIEQLLTIPNVDGVLVGNASLSFNKLKKIINIMQVI